MIKGRSPTQDYTSSHDRTPIGANLEADTKPSLDKVYVGTVKENTDVQRMGRLKVFIPELGGIHTDRTRWVTVSYCSPFAGATNPVSVRQDGKSDTTNQQSYGFWAVPPDLENLVVVMFINGEKNRGIWLGCLYQENMNQMTPGIATAPTYQGNVNLSNGSEVRTPSVEYNKRNSPEGANLYQNPTRARFTALHSGLSSQGLYSDSARGPSTASSRREAPSQVFGFKSPRGHHFYIDDGEIEFDAQGRPIIVDQQQKRKEGANEYIRLRTRSGAQLLINDTNGYIYAITGEGNSWLELSENGIHAYTASKLNLRAEEGINMHSDGDFNINVKGDFNVWTEGKTRIGSGNNMDLYTDGDYKAKSVGNLNTYSGGNTKITAKGTTGVKSGGDMAFKAPNIYHNTIDPGNAAQAKPKPTKGYPDNRLNGATTTNTIVSQMPHHEPWPEHTKRSVPPNAAEQRRGGKSVPDEYNAGGADNTDFPPSTCASILASKYESGGNPGAIGHDPVGGYSYGTVQIAAKVGSMSSFLDYAGTENPAVYQRLQAAGGDAGARAGTSEFKSAWNQLANEDPQGFAKLQKDWNGQANFNSVANRMQNDYGIDLNNDPTLRAVVYSQSTHMGPALSNRVIQRAFADIPPDQVKGTDRAELINRLYDERFKPGNGATAAYWRSSPSSIQNAMVSRGQRERADALALLKQEQAGTFPCQDPDDPNSPGNQAPPPTEIADLDSDAEIFDVLGAAEGAGYDTPYGGSKVQPPKPLSQMTVAEVLEWQERSVNAGSISSAAGKYQIINKTMNSLVREGTISPNDTFDQATQDRAALALMERRGLSKYRAGQISREQFANNMAKEWASLPVVTTQNRNGRIIQPGNSYYSGVAGNKSRISVDQFIDSIDRVRGSGPAASPTTV